MAQDYLRKKAELILGGDLCIPEGYTNPLFEMSDGKPRSAVLTFGPCRQRKKISDNGEFLLRPDGDGFVLERGGEIFLTGVGLKKMFCHSPDMAVISIARDDKVLSTEEALGLLRKYASETDLEGISLHADEPCTMEHYAEVVEAFHTECPGVPIGVGSTCFTRTDMELLASAGASNMKGAIPTPVGRILEKLEPRTDLDERKRYLQDAVGVFGRNNVVSTFYLGYGETDKEFLEAIDEFCSLGVMPDVKVKKLRGKAKEITESKLGKLEPVTPERYADIMTKVKDIISEHGLDPCRYNTMCYGCRCCNIVPFKDF